MPIQLRDLLAITGLGVGGIPVGSTQVSRLTFVVSLVVCLFPSDPSGSGDVDT